MNWLWFFLIWTIGLLFVDVQALCALLDGYLDQASMRRRGVTNGYSFMEHGGMWADIFIIAPIIAYVTAKYHLAYTSWYSLMIFLVATAMIGTAGYGYAKKGEKDMPEVMLPDAYVHDGKTTPAGWIHLLFAVMVLYIIVMFYFTPLNPPAAPKDVIIISLLLTAFFFLGICKFTRRWKFSEFAKRQIIVQCVILWGATAYKLLLLQQP